MTATIKTTNDVSDGSETSFGQSTNTTIPLNENFDMSVSSMIGFISQ